MTWWDSNWQYRKAITITDDTSQTYQLKLINVDTASLISAGKMNSDCSDMRFVDSDDTTLLPYFIEKGCNSADTKVWIKVSTANGDKTIYMYYGNSSATSASSYSDVFGSNINVMLPFDNDHTDYISSLSTSVSGTEAYTTDRNGDSDMAFSYDGSTYVAISDDPKISGLSQISISAWFYVTDTSGYSTIVRKGYSGGSTLEYIMRVNNDGSLGFYVYNTGGSSGSVVTSGSTISTNTWYHAVGTYDGSTVTLYLNGTSVGTASLSGAIFDGSTSARIGAGFTGDSDTSDPINRFPSGSKIDEFRIYGVALTSSQVQELYEVTEPTYSFGSEETNSSGITYNAIMFGSVI